MSSARETFLKEVGEQPAVLRDLVRFYRSDGMRLLELWRKRARLSGRVQFCGMGTSHFAPDAILGMLTEGGVDANTVEAAEALYYTRPARGIWVLVSQSGESVETAKLAVQLERASTVAITNTPASTISKAASLVLPMHAGHESAVSTKTYVNTVAVLHLMGEIVRDQAQVPGALSELERLAGEMDDVNLGSIERAADLVHDTGVLHLISRGPAMVAARQAVVTFMEGTRMTPAAFTGGGFRHGPFESVGPNQRAVFWIAEGKTSKLLESMAREIASHGARVVVITNRASEFPEKNCVVLRVPACAEEMFPIAAATAQELLLEALARRRGIEPGAFIHGTKITVKE